PRSTLLPYTTLFRSGYRCSARNWAETISWIRRSILRLSVSQVIGRQEPVRFGIGDETLARFLAICRLHGGGEAGFQTAFVDRALLDRGCEKRRHRLRGSIDLGYVFAGPKDDAYRHVELLDGGAVHDFLPCSPPTAGAAPRFPVGRCVWTRAGPCAW